MALLAHITSNIIISLVQITFLTISAYCEHSYISIYKLTVIYFMTKPYGSYPGKRALNYGCCWPASLRGQVIAYVCIQNNGPLFFMWTEFSYIRSRDWERQYLFCLEIQPLCKIKMLPHAVICKHRIYVSNALVNIKLNSYSCNI